MDTSGLYISATRIKSLSNNERAFLFGLLTEEPVDLPLESKAPLVAEPSSKTGHQENDDEHFAELSPSQARDFYAGCGDKTKKAVEAIAASPSRMFQLADIAKAVGIEPWELGHVWGGLTRRTKTVTDDPQAYLIDWHEGTQKYDDKDAYIDQLGEVRELTYNSFRKALKL